MKELKMYTDGFKLKYESFFTGCDAIEEMGLWNKELYGEMEAFYAQDIITVILRLIAADGKITRKETEYLNHVFGFDYTLEELTAVYENCRENFGSAFEESFENGVARLRKISSKLADAYKDLLATACRIIMASDGVAEAELAEVKRLQAMCE